MSKNSDLPAFPQSKLDRSGLQLVVENTGGLSKREYFAAIALQGLLVNAERNGLSFFSASAEAVRQADYLILELNKNEDAKS